MSVYVKKIKFLNRKKWEDFDKNLNTFYKDKATVTSNPITNGVLVSFSFRNINDFDRFQKLLTKDIKKIYSLEDIE